MRLENNIGCNVEDTWYYKQKEKQMVDNQHKMIKGYRDLSEAEINLMNRAKELAEEVGEFAQDMEDAAKNGNLSLDLRWLNIARTDLQKGFMSLIRSIAQPSTF